MINFAPERTPNGDSGSADDASLPFEQLAKQTYAAYADIDASPTKAWMVRNQAEESIASHWKLGFGPRAQEELYVLADDPHQVRNRADDPALSDLKAQLRAQLMAELELWDDPRLLGDQFDRPPYLNR